jgi:transcriptional regulator with XRE-family HTH domain
MVCVNPPAVIKLPYMMTPEQCRMARGALNLTVRALAAKAGVGVNTVTRLENGAETLASTVMKLQHAFEAAGVEFTNGEAPGVKLRPAKKRKKR